MKKWIRITLQILLYIMSHGVLVLSDLFPNSTLGIIVVSVLYCISTYYLWRKTTINTMVVSIIILLILEFIMINGYDGIGIKNKSEIHFKSMVNWLPPLLMVVTILTLIIRHLFKKKENEKLNIL
jgi:hypothetical protein